MKRMTVGLLVVAGVVALGTAAQAATLTWTGGSVTDPTNFEVADNWDSDSATVIVPRNNDYQDRARFTDDGSPVNKTPMLTTSRQINGLDFVDSVGWSITSTPGNNYTLHLKTVNSSGIGTNYISRVKIMGTHSWTIAEGNTFEAGWLGMNYGDLTLSGGGTLALGSSIGDYAPRHLRIQNMTVRVDAATVFSSSSPVTHLSDEAAILEILTTSSNVQDMIDAGQIVDETGLGLSVVEDGDYVRVSVLPEPATLGLLALGGLLVSARRRR